MTALHEHHDVLIVGAGLSGISAAVHLQQALPGKSFAILEKRQAVGGTWDLFRYPGVRSDSDMYTLGFDFKPWENSKAIADGASIREYIQSAAAEQGLTERIRFGHRVISAEWDTPSARWTVTCEVADGEHLKLTANYVHFGSGYYSYEDPFRPTLPGEENFAGEIIHPQQWPEGLDYANKRVVVIGSGATAMTLVPAMAREAAHVTMLQRSPTYVVALPAEDDLANQLRRVLPSHLAYRITRGLHMGLTFASYQYFRRAPTRARQKIRDLQEPKLPEGYPIDVHFNPSYDPWDQRLCVVPSGDLFRAITKGSAEIVTDQIETFTESGIRLVSGAELEADLVIAATGLNLEMLGGATLSVDGEAVDFTEGVAYKGMMFSGLPNMSMTFGYVNASWTLKADLVSRYVARLLSFMDERGYDEVLPVAPPADEELTPFLDLESGYIQRMIDQLPKQGSRDPWRVHQSYVHDWWLLRRRPVADEGVRFFTRNPGRLKASDPDDTAQPAPTGSDAPAAVA